MTIGAAQQFFLGASKATGGGAAGYQIERSLRFNSSDSAYLSRTPAVAGNRKTWTWTGWVKRSKFGTHQHLYICRVSANTDDTSIAFTDTDSLRVVTGVSNAVNTNAVFRDASAWYHIVCAFDTSQATAANRIKLYVNGVEQTYASTSYPSQNTDWSINSTSDHNIGRYNNAQYYGDLYLADIYFIDGQALTPSSFTEVSATTGQLIPKAYTGTFTGNSFWLKFADNSAATATTLGKDSSGLGNNWTPNNLSVTAGAGNDSLVDTPTSYGTDTSVGGEVRGNYCTFNPLFALASLTLTNGNLETSSPGAAWRNAKGTFAMTTGKWYWEHTVPTTGAADGYIGGVATATADYSSSSTGIWGRQGTTKYSNGSSSTPFGPTTSGDILGFAFDADAGKLWVAQNGTWVGDPGAGTGESWSGIPSGVFPYVAAYNQANVVNFGQRAFAYTNNRSGFKALVDTNLTAPLIAKPNTVMDVKLYTGNGSTQSITGLAFNPDLVWIKSRNNAYDHKLTDALRGATKGLISDTTGAETTDTNGLTAFNSDGFSLGTDTNYNGNAATYVAWTWDAGSSTVSNPDGSITSQVRANPSAGFSIVTYTGNGSLATVGHGLGVKPGFFVIKRRNVSSEWTAYHSALGATKYITLQSTAAAVTTVNAWNNTEPTSSVLTINNVYGDLNANGDTYVIYAWAPVTGYSSFGSYTGNGSADGPFVYTGFRPKWVLVKSTNITNFWGIMDSVRDPYNSGGRLLYPNSSIAEEDYTTSFPDDFLSNGFKPRNSGTVFNASGATYIYAAFAESPFQFSRAR